MTRRLSLILGVLLAAGAFIGVLVMGSVLNPSPYHVVVAIADVQPGTPLDRSMVGVDAQIVSPRVAEEYILAEELDRYLGGTVVRALVPGQPLMHRDVVAAGNPAVERHLALALEDPDLAAMVIPVGEDNAPDGIMAGDRIAIVWSVGEASYMSGPAGSLQIPSIYGPGIGAEEGVLPPVPLEGAGGQAVVEATVPAAEEVVLPLAKRIVNTAQVIRVRREQQANPAYTGQAGEEPYIEGRIVGLEVAVSLDEVEAVQFAIANGEYSIVVLSPNADLAQLADGSTLGVMWEDVMVYFRADRMRALGELGVAGPIRPGGASSIYGAILAPPVLVGGAPPGATPVPTPTSTPVPTPALTPVPTPAPTETAAPLPMPTATSAAAVVTAVAPEAPPQPAGLLVSTVSLLTGLLCVVGVLLGIGVGAVVAFRALRRRA